MVASGVPAQLGRICDFVLSEWFQARCVCCDCRVSTGVLCGECQRWQTPLPGCSLCGEPGEALCPACLLSPPPWDSLHSHWEFSGCARRYWLWVKYGANLWGMEPALESFRGPPMGEMEVIAVPQSREKTKKRGGDIVGRIATSLGGKTKIYLGRKNTRDQARLRLRDRGKNAMLSYYWLDKRKAPRRVLLVDDVYTSGATVRACTQLLKHHGAEEVHVWTLFRTPAR